MVGLIAGTISGFAYVYEMLCIIFGKDDSMYKNFVKCLVLFGVLTSLSSPAYAYIDPATGSIIVQSIIAAVASWWMYSKIYAERARKFFGRIRGRNKTEPE